VSTPATRQLTLALDEFGQTSLEAQADALELPPAGLVRQAALYLLAERGSGRPAVKIPRFAREQSNEAAHVELALELDEADWRALEHEAEEQHVALERLLVHATLLLLADLDSGRIAVRILEDED
jgi:hypothetical protein